MKFCCANNFAVRVTIHQRTIIRNTSSRLVWKILILSMIPLFLKPNQQPLSLILKSNTYARKVTCLIYHLSSYMLTILSPRPHPSPIDPFFSHPLQSQLPQSPFLEYQPSQSTIIPKAFRSPETPQDPTSRKPQINLPPMRRSYLVRVSRSRSLCRR